MLSFARPRGVINFSPDNSQPDGLILLVEDNDDDAVLTQQAFERAGVRRPIHLVRSGQEAIDYLNGDAPYWERFRYPIPGLVLLDIRMPGTDGFAVLRWIRQRTEFASVCVVMLTGEDQVGDADLAYQLGADCFLRKPLDPSHLVVSRSVELLFAMG